MLSAWSFLNFASHHRDRIAEAQQFRTEVEFFSLVTYEALTNNILVGPVTTSKLKVTCHRDDQQPLNPDEMTLYQNRLGYLWIIYGTQQQKLGHFPTYRLNLEEVSLSVFSYPTEKLIFEIPYQEITIKPPL